MLEISFLPCSSLLFQIACCKMAVRDSTLLKRVLRAPDLAVTPVWPQNWLDRTPVFWKRLSLDGHLPMRPKLCPMPSSKIGPKNHLLEEAAVIHCSQNTPPCGAARLGNYSQQKCLGHSPLHRLHVHLSLFLRLTRVINERSHHAEADRCMRFPTLLRASALTPCLAAHCTTSSRRPSLLCNTAHPEMSSPVTGQNLEPVHHAVTSQKDTTFVWKAVSTNFFTLDDAHYRKLYTPISAFLTAKIVKLTCTKHVSRVSAAALFSVGCAAEDLHGFILCWSAGISRSAGHSKTCEIHAYAYRQSKAFWYMQLL